MSLVETFDFESLKGIRWRVVGSGLDMPEGRMTVDLEWENGKEASFSSFTTDLRFWADDWMDSHHDDEWVNDPLPTMFSDDQWFRDAEPE